MLPGAFRDRVKIQHRTKTPIATGITEVWADVQTRAARVIPLSTAARAEYAQLRSEVTHAVEFRGRVSLALGDDRLVWMTGGSKILELAEPPQYSSGRANCTRVAVQESI